jgi:hypothetical protein
MKIKRFIENTEGEIFLFLSIYEISKTFMLFVVF